jgi:ABC-type phosphate transport system substrate-binding protein
MKSIVKRWHLLVVVVGILGFWVASCSVFFDHSSTQCTTDNDCAKFGDHPYCQNGVCVASGLGPDGCFFGTPAQQSDYENQCSTAQCSPFDNCGRLGLCASTDQPPSMVPPPPIDAAPPFDASLIDAPPPPVLPNCVDGVHNTIVVAGSTAIQPFLAVLAPILSANTPPYQIAYQPSGSCTGAVYMFDPDPLKHVVKDIKNKQAIIVNADGTTTPCTFGAGVQADVIASDVYGSTCNSAYALGDTLAEYFGPIQPMTFVVPATSSQQSISAEMAHVVFGLGNTDANSAPWTTPSLYFIRNSGSGTQQMISRAIGIDPKQWWGRDRGSSGNVRDQLEAVDPSKSDSAIGILSTDFADPARGQLRVLAFKDTGQTCAYYPDSTQFTRDKRNVRDGHYPIWGPVHFFARVAGGIPGPNAAAFVTRFTLPRLDKPLLDAITKSGLVPACAMTVQHTGEMGPFTPYSPPFQCGCYFEATVQGGAAPASCIACAGPSDCPSAKPACNNGYCELQ